MKKNGFTLIEVIGVIILLAVIALISIPLIEKQLKDSKNDLYNDQITTIELATQNWLSEHPTAKPNKSESVTIMLSNLKKEGFIAPDLTNPIDKKYFPNDMLIRINNKDDIIEYEVLKETGTDYTLYDKNKPTITLNGDEILNIELGSTYTELGTVEQTSIEGNVDTSKVGVYFIVYRISGSNPNSYIRNVFVRDTKAPVIDVTNDDMVIYDNELVSTDFLQNVTVTDKDYYTLSTNSNVSVVPGTYTVTYVAKDTSGNESTKNIKVTVKKTGKPIFKFSGNLITFEKGTQYDLMLGVSAIDADGLALNNITCTINGSACGNTTTLNSGTYTVTYTAKDVKGNTTTVTRSLLVKQVIEFSYTGGPQTFTAALAGKYKIELWGASGGRENPYGSMGGYTSGEITLNQSRTLYIYVGGEGVVANKTALGGYNGGGNSTATTANKSSGETGGGATDVRLVSGAWNSFDSLKSRIMVAGGGGGGYTSNTIEDIGGKSNAGGLLGYDAGYHINDEIYISYYGKGASQISGGSAPSIHSCAQTNGTVGTFGMGGIGGKSSEESNVGGGSGGGGGYYGGSGSGGLCNGYWSAGGGSSFISGHAGSNAISASSTSSNIIHTNTANHYSGLKFANTIMIDGAGYSWSNVKKGLQVMPKPDKTNYGLGLGHVGNGYARITYLGN